MDAASAATMHPNEKLARHELELINSGKLKELADLYADDFVFHYPGRNPLSGDYSDLADFIAKAQELFGEGTLTRQLIDAFGSEARAVQLLRVTAQADGRSHSWDAVVVYDVQDGRFSKASIYVDDQHALDGFLNSLQR